MAVVVLSERTLVDVSPTWGVVGIGPGSLRMYDQYNYDYATLYRLQPNVRTCVDFLARNIAQLGLHVYRRVSDTDRERLTDNPLARVIEKPLPAEYKVTRYRLIEALVADLGIYFNAYWLKIRRQDGVPAGLLRIPPQYVTVYGGLVPTRYELNLGGTPKEIAPDELVHIRGYNPENPIFGLSPLETLRRILAEEHSAGDYREFFWRNGARINGIIERPMTAPEWSAPARARFKSEFEALYAGGPNSGRTAILEEDMKWKEASFNPQESEYLGGRKLTREECARAYHIPPPFVGILDHATFSNIKEQHKSLYADTLGPWLTMIQEDVELQLMPEFGDSDGVYVEFNIAEKLAGSFEEQTQALQSAVGRPWMSADEARARFNMPSMGGDAARLVTPLNVIVGGQASPRDSAPEKAFTPSPRPSPVERGRGQEGAKAFDPYNAEVREQHEQKWRSALMKHYRRQERAIMSRIPESFAHVPDGTKSDLGGVWWDDERWNNELYADLLPLNVMTATTWADLVASSMEAEANQDMMLPWLEEHTRIQAQYINERTRGELETALRDPDPRRAAQHIFELATTAWALVEAMSAVTSALNFGAVEGARASGLTRKIWQVNSSNPRDTHAALNGVAVGLRDKFPNGLRWPGDPAGSADENAGCQCSVRFE